MSCVRTVVFLFLNFFTLNLRAETTSDCSGISNLTECLQSHNYTLAFCEDFKENTLTPTDSNYIVSFHNNFRKSVVKGQVKKIPKGFYIKKLTWNNDLAKLAQKWAEQCQSVKDSDFRLFESQLLGRNVAVVDGQDPFKVSLERLMNIWLGGLDNLSPDVITKYRKPTNKKKDFEPVVQMLWWNTSEIGCSRSVFTPVYCIGEGRKNCTQGRQIVQLACNYFPVGNKVGEPVYSTNTSSEYICQYDNNDVLCSSIQLKPTKRSGTGRSGIIYRMRGDFASGLWPAAMNSANSWNLDFLFCTYFFFICLIH